MSDTEGVTTQPTLGVLVFVTTGPTLRAAEKTKKEYRYQNTNFQKVRVHGRGTYHIINVTGLTFRVSFSMNV